MRTGIACVAALASALALACAPAGAQVKVWQGTMTLPTYEEGAPNPNPPFNAYATTQFSYPYTLRTNLTGQKADHTWRAVFLENEYLKCSVLPDIGGHLYTCIDKISGKSMFYNNPSIKKAQIGYRGAWAAFGVEFNFPVSHNWVSMSPVDFAYAAHPDGSASVSIGNIDRVYGMQWGVELVLRPGSTLLEERVTLYNRSDVRHRYYWWNNAGIEVWDDSRVEYPMQFVASHGFTDVYHWPVASDGKDLSIIKNQTDGPVSFFVHGSREPFMGIWNPKTQTGTVHYAEYSELPGKKIWSWGADTDGLGWRKALSDNNSAYVEVQGGLFRNQETYAFLDPGQTIRFSEFWMPVRDIGGISRANKTGVVSFQSRGPETSVALNVNEHIQGAQIALQRSGRNVWCGTVDLSPEKTWSHVIPAKEDSANLAFELKDREGKLLLQHTDGKYDWDAESTIEVGPQATYRVPDEADRTEDEWFRLGTDLELNGKTAVAFGTYKKALTKYPASFTLQMAAGRLAVSLQHNDEAKGLLQAVQKRDTPNAEVAYYLGLAEERLGQLREAQTSFEMAYRQAEFRSRAAVQLASLRARQGDMQGAQTFMKASVEAASNDILAIEQFEAVVRATGDTAQADRMLQQGLKVDPMSDFLKEEAGTPDLAHLAADPYRVLRVAGQYMALGLYQKALITLERTYPRVPADQGEPGSVLPQENPLVLYYAAYCKSKLGQDAGSSLQAAQRLSTSLIFPSTPMDRTVLEAVISANSAGATARYLLGTLYFSMGLYDQGIEEWVETKHLAPKLPVLDVDLGKAWLHIKDDPKRALKAFQQGVESDPANADVYVGLDQTMSLTGVSAKERAEALGHYPSANSPTSQMPANLVYQLALTRAEAGQYDDALALFNDRFFPSEEGGVSAAQVLFELKLMQAEAKADSGRCAEAVRFLDEEHPGLVVNGASSHAYVRMAAIAKTCQRAQQSEELLKKAAAGKVASDAVWSARAEKLLGSHDIAQQQKNLETALAICERVRETSAFTGWWWYNTGLIHAALHHDTEARKAFGQALLLPDSLMSHHLSRKALTELASVQTP